MTVTAYRWVLLIACVLIVALVATAWNLALKCAVQRTEARGAWSAVAEYGRCRDTALRSAPEQAVEQLYIIACLPPRRTNDLDPLLRMVERERDRDIHDIIAYLRTKTHDDLGNDPAKWIEKYSGHEKR